MRDPDRIKPMLEALEKLWSAQPDLRLGQLIVNLAARPGDLCPGVFFLEDDEMLRRIQADISSRNGAAP